MKFSYILIFLILSIAYSRTLNEIREEAKKCGESKSVVDCVGNLALEIYKAVGIKKCDLKDFAKEWKEDNYQREKELDENAKEIGLEEAMEFIKNGQFIAFTSQKDTVVALESKKEKSLLKQNDKAIPLSIFHELVHLLSGKGGVSGVMKSTLVFEKHNTNINEGMINYFAEMFQERHPDLVSKAENEKFYVEPTNYFKTIDKYLKCEKEIFESLFTENGFSTFPQKIQEKISKISANKTVKNCKIYPSTITNNLKNIYASQLHNFLFKCLKAYTEN